MILDATNLYSDDQAVTADAASTNIIDHGASRDVGPGNPVKVLCQVTVDFATCTSITFSLETDDNTGFSSAVKLQEVTVLLAGLVAGAQITLSSLPHNVERYTRVYYTVNGSDATAGKITAGLASDVQQNDFTA